MSSTAFLSQPPVPFRRTEIKHLDQIDGRIAPRSLLPIVLSTVCTVSPGTHASVQDCDWVAEFVPTRCTVVGYDKTLAWEACPEACYMMYEDDEPSPMNLTMDAVDMAIMQYYKGGQYNECPPETMYWEHDESVYGGYSGCVGEQLYTPCEQDGFDPDSFEAGTKFYTYDETTGMCMKTDYTVDNRTFWIIWGLPTDTNTLIEKTGLNPVIKFPLLRQTYPSYTWQGSEIADDSSAKPLMKSWLTYLGIFTAEETEDFEIVMTEVRRQTTGFKRESVCYLSLSLTPRIVLVSVGSRVSVCCWCILWH